MNKYLIALIVVILAFAAWYFYTSQIPAPVENNFIHDGIVIKDNPGFKPGVWFLSYEEPGSSGLSVELDLNSVPTPYISLTQGQPVHVEGNLHESVLTVRSITPISP